MVGRPREFDTDEVLDAAMRAFWAKGYESTSLADLMSATGLHKGSLYQAFGDKHSLFVRSLKRYLEDMRRQELEQIANAETPLAGIRSAAHLLVDLATEEGECPKGCLAINSLVELAPHDREIQEIMSDHIRRMEQSLEETVRRAQTAGEIGTERPAGVITGMLMTFVAGLSVTTKGLVTPDQAHQLLDAQLEAVT